MIAWLLISFFVMLALGVPIAMSLGLAAIGGILFLDGGVHYRIYLELLIRRYGYEENICNSTCSLSASCNSCM